MLVVVSACFARLRRELQINNNLSANTYLAISCFWSGIRSVKNINGNSISHPCIGPELLKLCYTFSLSRSLYNPSRAQGVTNSFAVVVYWDIESNNISTVASNLLICYERNVEFHSTDGVISII